VKMLWDKMERSPHAGWRVCHEAVVLECFRQLYAEYGASFTPVAELVSVRALQRLPPGLAAVPAGSFVVTVPDVRSKTTHVFVITTEMAVTHHLRLEGLPLEAEPFLPNKLSSGKSG
jgi:hypothetical protein